MLVSKHFGRWLIDPSADRLPSGQCTGMYTWHLPITMFVYLCLLFQMDFFFKKRGKCFKHTHHKAIYVLGIFYSLTINMLKKIVLMIFSLKHRGKHLNSQVKFKSKNHY